MVSIQTLPGSIQATKLRRPSGNIYFTDNLEYRKLYPKKAWQLSNDLSSRHLKRRKNISEITALFNNTRTLKLKFNRQKRFSLPSIKCSAGHPSLRLLPNSVRCLNCAQRFDYRAFGSSRKLGGAGRHLIDGSEKRICRLSFEF